jgi:hypothetical protein
MADWLEQWHEQIRQENEDAIRKDFARCVAEEDLPDTEDAWKGYVHGWYGTKRFASAKRELNEAGHGSYMFAILAWICGTLMLGMMVVSYYTFPHENLALDRFGYIAIGSIAVIAAGFLLMKRARRLATTAGKAHQEKWGKA